MLFVVQRGMANAASSLCHWLSQCRFSAPAFSRKQHHHGQPIWPVCSLIAVLCIGCSRTHHRMRADAETYGTLAEKTVGFPWSVDQYFTVIPDGRSRFRDATPIDDPCLPVPTPRLYAYEIPWLAGISYRPPTAEGKANDGSQVAIAFRSPTGESAGNLLRANGDKQADELFRLPPIHYPADSSDTPVIRQVSHAEVIQSETPESSVVQPALERIEPSSEQFGLRIVPIPAAFWDAVPANCQVRMFEFSSIRREFERTFTRDVSDQQRDDSNRLSVEDIVELTLINSREFQEQKELLYSVALRLTLQRYDYALKFSPLGNGTAADYRHSRVAGVTENTLSLPTSASVEKTLASGGNLLARFANDVVLTFNGADGFSREVGSELLFDLSQSLLQRDIVFESLTQSERDVVYAARSFARFRKQLFRDAASRYYRLLLAFRAIEINALDYFSNVRGFQQALAEFQQDKLPRFQVDQFEQGALRSRSNLNSACNELESSFDELKQFMGIPIETPINLDLSELRQLSLRDEATVASELINRARRSLTSDLNRPELSRALLVNGSVVLAERMKEWLAIQRRMDNDDFDTERLELSSLQLAVEERDLLVSFNQQSLDSILRQSPASPPLVLGRTVELADSLLQLASGQYDLIVHLSGSGDRTTLLRVAELRSHHDTLRDRLRDMSQQDNLQPLIAEATRLADDARDLVRANRQALRLDPTLSATRARAVTLMDLSQQWVDKAEAGLIPIEADMDEAMLTALVQRFDLMNVRGALADTWRRIKLSGDDLRSVLNLNATQIVRTRSDVNRPFDFSWDESETRLGISIDTPLNRKAQRNAFRQSLINYQVGLRNLMAAEDAIKFSVRDDLRNLQLGREQYDIAVAGAALSYERVVSTRLQLALEQQNVTARDVLESQQAYTASLSAVAGEHIDYILDRIDLFLDLELLEVDEAGFWPQLYDESFHPAGNFVAPPGGEAYGELPARVWYSDCIRRMERVPVGLPVLESAER